MSIGGLILTFVLSTIEGVVQDELVERLKKPFQKDYLDTFVVALEQAVEQEAPLLKKFSPDNDIEFQSQLFKALLAINDQPTGRPDISGTSSSLVSELADLFWDHQLILIGGNTLSEEDYKRVTRNVLLKARDIFWKKLSLEQRDALLLHRVDQLESSFELTHSSNLNQFQGIEYRLQKIEDDLSVQGASKPENIQPQIRYRFLVNSLEDEALLERQQILQVLQKSPGAIPIESNMHFDTPIEDVKPLITQADVFVTVLTEGYGQIGDSGRSRPHELYLIAKAENKPSIVYIKNTEAQDDKRRNFITELEDSNPFRIRYYSKPEDLRDYFFEDMTSIINSLFSLMAPGSIEAGTDYLVRLQEEMEAKKALRRDEVLKLLNDQLDTASQIMLVGEPGIGKTFILGQYAQQSADTFYISLKNRGKNQILAYLTNRLRSLNGELSSSFNSDIDVRTHFEIASHKAAATILIDDVDSQPEFAVELLTLASPHTKIILASRSRNILKDYPIRIIDIEPLSAAEIRQFVNNAGIDVGPRKMAELENVSKGNPLYLYYFSVEQIDPLPASISDYQGAIWRIQNDAQRDILALCALSLYGRSVLEVHEARSKLTGLPNSPMATSALIDQMNPIVRLVDGWVEIFHPVFADFVVDQLQASGLAIQYHTILGEVSLKHNQTVETAYHFDLINDARANDYYLPAARSCILSGDYHLAEQFLTKLLKAAEETANLRIMGEIYFGLSLLYSETARLEDGKEYGEKAVQYLRQAADDTYAVFVETWMYAAFIELVDPHDAIKRTEESIKLFLEQDVDENTIAILRVNLSNMLIRSSYFQAGLEMAEEAYATFEKLNNQEGMITAITNINSGLANTPSADFEKMYTYASKILEAADRLNMPRLRIAGLNHIALYQRRKDHPDEAIASLAEAVALAQSIQDHEREALNLNNMGNAYVDLENYVEAERCYLEALSVAEEHSIVREKARAYELMVRLKLLTDENRQALELAEKAIELYASINDDFRIASTLEYSGWIYQQFEDFHKAAATYQRAAEIYTKFGDKDAETYFNKASQCWFIGDELEKSIECAYRRIVTLSPDYSVLGENSHYKLLEYSLETSPESDLGDLILCICGLLKRDYDSDRRKKNFEAITHLLIDKYRSTHSENLLNALAIAIDQGDESLLDPNDFDSLASTIVEEVEGLYRRKQALDHEIYTIGMRWSNQLIVQIASWEEDTFVNRLALTLSLVLVANREYLETQALSHGGLHESWFILEVMKLSEFRKYVMPLDDGPGTTLEFPFTVTHSNVPWTEEQPETVGILFDEYSKATDWNKRPGNKALVWVLMNFHGVLLRHCTHHEGTDLARLSRKFAERVLN